MKKFQKTHAHISILFIGGLFIFFVILLVILSFFPENNGRSIASEAITPETTAQNDEPLSKTANELEDLKNENELAQGSCPAGTSNFTYTLFHVNSKISLGGYIPPRLVELPSSVEILNAPICLQEEVALQLLKMNSALKEEGYTLVVTSGFRDASIQDILHTRSLKEINLQNHASVAPPQHSEHQLGTTVDVTSLESYGYTSRNDFGGTETYQWLSDHAHEYGFVQSYQVGKEAITGYIAEPWHFRYVGVEVATHVRELDLSLDEYLAQDLFLK